ncbi:long-chain acyl-CoA synthetase [Antricoccus suffuscus]|uniref:Long-chain acyl-CoA synthetase n=1 Tax=Antricoccus suffuscus TaxID=1629062 RepID=A0A2T1A1P4_9ACTN|nr:class I adenylate-forming enzyme family protein [Antricoccus suffuscus]PRZ42522.1 long-chain acyl-CoA synthetase [Antricoccus suffuscus]
MATPRFDKISDYLRYWASKAPGRTAYRHGEDVATYSRLNAEVDRFARALLAAGVGAGDRVAVRSTPRPEFWISFLATTSIGAVWLGINPRYKERELDHVISDSKPRIVFAQVSADDRTADDELTRVLVDGGAPPPVTFGDEPTELAEFLAAGGEVSSVELKRAQNAVEPDRAALIVYTSGSTGVPKGAMLSNVGLCRSFEIQARHHGDDVMAVIANLPINHIGGVGDLCCTPFINGGSIVFQETFDPAAILRAVERDGVTTLMQVPTMLKMIAEHPAFDATDLTTLKSVHWGGGPLPLSIIEAYRSRGLRVGTTYGLTEITGSVTYSKESASSIQLSESVGHPVDEVDLRLEAEDGSAATTGKEGEILVRHPGQFIGYFNRPDATSAAMSDDGYLRTGDVGVLEPDGSLRLVGRMHEMYKSGGYNVYPREVELVLESHPEVRLSAVVARPDPVYDEVGVAFVEIGQFDEEPEIELRRWCRARLANFKIPKEFRIVEALPLLPIGKVDKVALREQARG